MTTRWTIGIDWDRDGNYTDETARVLSAKWMLGFQQAYKVGDLRWQNCKFYTIP